VGRKNSIHNRQDEETGLYYFGARYYDPRTSVWQSADPILAKYLPSIRNGRQVPGVVGGVFESSNLGVPSVCPQVYSCLSFTDFFKNPPFVRSFDRDFFAHASWFSPIPLSLRWIPAPILAARHQFPRTVVSLPHGRTR
jgi:hypothetical protein